MTGLTRNRLLAERPLPRDGRQTDASTPAPGAAPTRKAALLRSVTVNMAESPLGWLKARGLVDDAQFHAGERLRADWERAQLSPRVTMRWDAPPMGASARGAPETDDPTTAQLAAKRRFEAAIAAVGPGLSDIAWRVLCAANDPAISTKGFCRAHPFSVERN